MAWVLPAPDRPDKMTKGMVAVVTAVPTGLGDDAARRPPRRPAAGRAAAAPSISSSRRFQDGSSP